MKLYIGNQNYSSWSMRPWVLMREAGIAFEEVKLRFDSFQLDSQFKAQIGAQSPVGKVPVLVDGDLKVWDTLAIAEYLAERFPEKGLWPARAAQRARARSVCAEMHSGFAALRSAFPMNIEANLPEIGQIVLRDRPAVRDDLSRIDQMWTELLNQAVGGGMLFGAFTIADAFFAPVCMRIKTYHLPLNPECMAYVERICALQSVQAWVCAALEEHDFRDFEEPYRVGQ